MLPSSAHATSELASSLRQLKDKWDSGGADNGEGHESNSSGSGSPGDGDGGEGGSNSEASHSKSFMSPLAKKNAAAAAGEGEGGTDDGGGDPAMSLRAATARLHVLEKEVGEAHGRESELREELVQARAEIRRLRGLVQEYEEGLNPGEDPQRRATIGDNHGEDHEDAEPDFEEVRMGS